MKVKVALIQNENLGYTIYVPSLKGCVSEGNTKEEALINIKEAIELYLDNTDDDAIYEANSHSSVS